MKIPRNDPCPCGSGKKYKKCCLPKQNYGVVTNLKGEISELIAGREFGSIQEAQEVLETFNLEKNTEPLEDFHGLSPKQMDCFLNRPFETPDLITFPTQMISEPESEAFFLLAMLITEIADDGHKLTLKGNLGQKFCRQVQEKFLKQYPPQFTSELSVNKESDFGALHTIRLTAQLAGLVRKYKGRLVLTRKCRDIMASSGLKGLYPSLLHAYIQEFNWGYRDGFQEIPFIQNAFLFTLYLLKKYGGKWRSESFYTEIFLRAFPTVLREVEGEEYRSPEETVQRCYIMRTLERFIGFFGLAEVEVTSNDLLDRQYRIRSTGLLDQVVVFHLF